jgi:hypothetical protein
VQAVISTSKRSISFIGAIWANQWALCRGFCCCQIAICWWIGIGSRGRFCWGQGYWRYWWGDIFKYSPARRAGRTVERKKKERH